MSSSEDETLSLFKEVERLITSRGLKASKVILRSINSSKNSNQLYIYEYIISTICDIHDVSEKDLFNGSNTEKITDARRSTYASLRKYLGYSNSKVKILFDKDTSTITKAMNLHKSMLLDKRAFHPYLQRHEAVELKMETFLQHFKSNINNNNNINNDGNKRRRKK